MKTTCPKCGDSYDIADKAIIDHARRSTNLRRKLAAMLAGIGGRRSLDTMTADQRKARAAQAAQTRWKKDE